MQPEESVSESPQLTPKKWNRKRIGILLSLIFAFILVGVCILVALLAHRVPEKNSAATNVSNSASIDTSSLSTAYDSFAAAGIKEFTADRKAATLASFDSLTKGFSANSKMLSDKSNALIGLGIAYVASSAAEAEKVAYRYEMYLLAKPYMKSKPADIIDESYDKNLSDDQAKAVYGQYMDRRLTDRVKSTITGQNLLKDTNSKLNIAPQNAKPYELVVVNFNQDTSAAKTFESRLGMTGWMPPVWNDKRTTFNYIVFTKEQALAFLDTSQRQSASGVILHEYTHSQEDYTRGDGLTRALEERRAEHFSGDTGAYYDVKQFFVYLNVFSGVDILSLMDSYPSDSANFYLNLYQGLGVSLANKVVMATPNIYLQDQITTISKIESLTDGYNSALSEAYDRGSQNQAELKTRMKDRADKLMVIFKSKSAVLSDLSGHTEDEYKLEFAAQKMRDYINNGIR